MGEKCVTLLPGVKFCVTQTENGLDLELEAFGHKVWGTSVTVDQPCTNARIHIFMFSAEFTVCADFKDKWVEFDGQICVVGKCSDVKVKINY